MKTPASPAVRSAGAQRAVLLGRLTVRVSRRHVLESQRLLEDVAQNAIATRALRNRVLDALRRDEGLTAVVEWLRARGYEVSREGLLAAWAAWRPGAPAAPPGRFICSTFDRRNAVD